MTGRVPAIQRNIRYPGRPPQPSGQARGLGVAM